MSQENVEIVRAYYEIANREGAEAAIRAACATSDFECDLSRATGLDKGVYDFDGLRRMASDFLAIWHSTRFEATEMIDAGDHVVVGFVNHHLGRDGIAITARGYWVYTIRDGAITRWCLYQERDEALEAVGLSEQDPPAEMTGGSASRS